jgi:hypothetical protein
MIPRRSEVFIVVLRGGGDVRTATKHNDEIRFYFFFATSINAVARENEKKKKILKKYDLPRR